MEDLCRADITTHSQVTSKYGLKVNMPFCVGSLQLFNWHRQLEYLITFDVMVSVMQ